MRKNYLICFLSGALLDLALAPFYLFPVLFISFPILYFKIKEIAIARQAFWSGWWFGFGYFVFGLYWISNSLLVDLRFAWLIPFAVSLIPAVAAIYIGAAMYVYKKFKIESKFAFALLWVLAEYLKGIFPFGGFPWNNIGYASLFSIEFAQIASIGGVYFAGLVVIFLSLFPALLINRSVKRQWFGGLAFIIILVAIFGFGYFKNTETKYSKTTAIIVQPNIAQTLKWDEGLMRRNFFDTLALASGSNADIVVLPEAAIPYHINRDARVAELIGATAKPGGYVIASSTRSENEQVWNTMFVLDSQGIIESSYDKHHLVPFGEYVPFRSVLPIEKITPGMTDFSASNEGKTLPLPGGNFLPLICYEIIFPEYSKGNYDFIVNITNDAWFGDSTGPRQHLAMSQMRAIEQGRPVLRSANTGISAIIDSNGNLVKTIGYNEKGNIETAIPTKLGYKTLYSKYGDRAFFLLASIVMIILVVSRKLQLIRNS